jgi:hypothetical protein
MERWLRIEDIALGVIVRLGFVTILHKHSVQDQAIMLSRHTD